MPKWFPGQGLASALVIALGAALACWALLYFRAWRPRAKLDAGHPLATGGPFSDLRARAEEKLLLATFGDAYRSYSARTRRFIPEVY